MRYFQKICSKFSIAILLAGFLVASENVIYGTDSSPHVTFDDAGNIVGVWINDNGTTSIINGTYDTTFPVTPTALTDPSVYSVSGPTFLVNSTATVSGGAAAVVVYAAFDIAASVERVLVSTATTSGWNTTPIALSLNDGTEYPNTDYNVCISPDGVTIIIIWTSFLTGPGDVLRRSAVSTDGGASFTVT